MDPRTLEQQIADLAALGEPIRRSLYFFVASAPREVSRDEAAQAAGVSRMLAGFHLDRLVQDGLLESTFRRLTGRTGPGAGRPAKLYRRADRQIEVSLPQRSYELAARILADAVEAGGVAQAREALSPAARRMGRRIGTDARARVGSRPGRKRLLAGTVDALAANGYGPERGPHEIRLRNCPFHALVGEHRDLVCGMNLALIEGVVDGIQAERVKPVLDPKPGMCCVALRLEK